MGIGKNIHKSIFVLGEARYSRHGHLRHKGESSSVNGGAFKMQRHKGGVHVISMHEELEKYIRRIPSHYPLLA